MEPAFVPAALAFGAAVCMAAYVGLRRDKTELHWLLIALFASLAVWTCGTLLRLSATDLGELRAALRVGYLGVFTAPPLWLLVAAQYARADALLGRRERWAGLALPSALAYVALLTNDSHRLLLRELSFEALEGGGLAWAGPVFWIFLAWAYACVFGGMFLYLGAARALMVGPQRHRGVVLAVASVLPLLATSAYLFRLLPVRFDLTPAALTVSMVLMSIAVFRFHILESLPLARRDVMDHLHDGVLMASASGTILDLNRAAAHILRREAGDLRQQSLGGVLGDLGDGESVAALHAGLAELLPDAPPLIAEVRTADERLVEVQVAWVRDGRGTPAGQFAVLRDRTEERRYERVVRHAQKLRTVGTLASGIAHEVNNPLAFIRANLSQLREMGERVDAALTWPGADGKLASELAELSTITEETLDGIARIEGIVSGIRRLANNRKESFRPTQVNEVVEDALRLSNLSRDGEIRLELELAPELEQVDAIPERLVQALLNLLINARQALEGRPGSIHVSTARVGGRVEIRVRDDGPGVPDEIQERIFDPFFTTKDPDRGTGLGLAIAYDILRDHSGVLELRVVSGPGACFVASLPVQP